jgi:soluble lytic murein transglycosylase-like protein
VFNQFSQKATKANLKIFDLDREIAQKGSSVPIHWEHVFGKRAVRYAPLVVDTSKKFEKRGYKVDPLLFMALMKRESNFKPRAVSPVGAAGLTQIMPKTGKDLGMKNIYEPAYLAKAFSLTKEERRTRALAKSALFKIEVGSALGSAKKARALSQKALLLAKQRERLFARYKGELLKKQNDDRLQPAMAIEHGFRYFARLLKMQKGDISLALASYNAGPGRVTQYGGIPPYQETVLFRNRVLQYYRDYHRRANQLK